MSIMKFIEDDILSEIKSGTLPVDLIDQLFDNLDMTILSMDFFRNLYAPSDSKNEVLKIILKICEHKKIQILNFDSQIDEFFVTPKLDKAVSAILFLLVKTNNGKFSINFSIIDKNIILDVRGCIGEIQKRLISILSDADSQEKNAFNIIVYYAKKLLSSDKLTIKTETKIVDTLRIKICK